MILVIYQLDVIVDKRKEFLQAVPNLLSTAAQQPGYVRYHISRDIDDDNSFYVFQEWENQSALDVYWQSGRFAAFWGTSHLLKRTPSVRIHAVSFTAGMEAVNAARSKSKIPNTGQNETKPMIEKMK